MSTTTPGGFNVVGLLSTLYTAGAKDMPPPSADRVLKGRTLHALYAISFIVYSVNCICDWIHTYFALIGYSISFPLKPWLVVTMVCAVVAGTVLTLLLLVLCIEHAFVQRSDVAPYRSGFAVICEKFGAWVTGFNNFRVAFLILLLQDAPMTVINFWFVSSCRSPGPLVLVWPLVISSASTIISICWRLTMLYYAYKHMLCKPPAKQPQPASEAKDGEIKRESSTLEDIKLVIGYRTTDRIEDYDECWPVRFGIRKAYGIKENEDLNQNSVHRSTAFGYGRSWSRHCPNWIRVVALTILRPLSCCFMTLFLYVGMCLSCCAPCFYHYCCRRNSLYHRHKFARSCTRYSTIGYNAIILVFSAVFAVSLLIVNLVWISSIHVIGHHGIPPEMSQICIEIDESGRQLRPLLLPNVKPASNHTVYYVCKPIWEAGSLGFGFQRKKPGLWETRRLIKDELLIVSTRVEMDYGHVKAPLHVLHYDYAMKMAGKSTGVPGNNCYRREKSGWTVPTNAVRLPWPYFAGCYPAYKILLHDLFDCNSTRSGDISEIA
uniref:Palmitoyltransferase n=1 Tax=Plectus sambesii TaxID=2011161 RepID=A0A914XJF5_9BILA